MSESLKAAAYAAGLSEQDKRKIDNLSKALTVHKNLLAMPAEAANAVYKSLPQNQQQNLVQNFGEETEEKKPKQGWLGTANHYTGYQAYKALNFLADRVSQTYRAVAIPLVERNQLGFAWDDPSIGIDWPIRDAMIIGQKDSEYSNLDDLDLG